MYHLPYIYQPLSLFLPLQTRAKDLSPKSWRAKCWGLDDLPRSLGAKEQLEAGQRWQIPDLPWWLTLHKTLRSDLTQIWRKMFEFKTRCVFFRHFLGRTLFRVLLTTTWIPRRVFFCRVRMFWVLLSKFLRKAYRHHVCIYIYIYTHISIHITYIILPAKWMEFIYGPRKVFMVAGIYKSIQSNLRLSFPSCGVYGSLHVT